MMKAVVQQGYGSLDALELREVEKPTPGDGEVLVRVHAASVHPDVWHVVSGRPHVLRLMGAGFFKPKNPIPGTDMAGVVEAVSVPTSGYIALLNFGESTQVSPGQEVLVNGAGGGVGALALQLAKAHGARVTAVDSTKKLGLLRDLGADEVIDYTREDFTKRGVRYDLIFDIPGNHPFSECRRALTPEGTYILIGHERFGESGKRVLGLIPHFFKLMFLSLFVKQLPKPNFSMPSKKDTMTVLRELLEAGKITPVIDRTYSLGEASEAIHYLMHGEPPGRVVITP
jgi:NADPH:quinone reductase-like Zn-dependent oxidoreductase